MIKTHIRYDIPITVTPGTKPTMSFPGATTTETVGDYPPHGVPPQHINEGTGPLVIVKPGTAWPLATSPNC